MSTNKSKFKQNIFRMTAIGASALALCPSIVNASLVTTFNNDTNYINRNVEESTRSINDRIMSTTSEKELTEYILKEAGRRDAEIESKERKKELELQVKKEIEQERIKYLQEQQRLKMLQDQERQRSLTNASVPNSLKSGGSIGKTNVSKDLNIIYDIVSKQKDKLTEDQIEVVKNIPKYLGKNYVWGATGPDGYDCSGFTQSIMRDVGYNIVRVSGDQYNSNNFKIPAEDLSLGDLVFFKNTGSRSGITHVGMYIGDGVMVHASSSSNAIRTEYVFSSYFANKYVGAVRYIK